MLLKSYKVLKFIIRYFVPAPLRYPIARSTARWVCRLNARRRSVIVANLTPLVGPAKAAELAPVLLGNFLMTGRRLIFLRETAAQSSAPGAFWKAGRAWKRPITKIVAR